MHTVESQKSPAPFGECGLVQGTFMLDGGNVFCYIARMV